MNDVTHLGLCDIPMMANIPNLVYLAPTTKEEYLAMLDWSIEQNEYPVAIKLPGGSVISDGKEITKDFGDLNKYEVTQKGSKVAVIGLGTFYGLCKEVAEELKKVTGTDATVINPYYITGIDAELLLHHNGRGTLSSVRSSEPSCPNLRRILRSSRRIRHPEYHLPE